MVDPVEFAMFIPQQFIGEDPALVESVINEFSSIGVNDFDAIGARLEDLGLPSSADAINAIQSAIKSATGIAPIQGAVGAASSGVSTLMDTLGDIGGSVVDAITAHPYLTLGTGATLLAIGGAETYLTGSVVKTTQVVPDGTICSPSCVSPSVCVMSVCVTPSTPASAVCNPACGTGQQCVDNICKYTDLGTQLKYQGILGTALSWFGTGLFGQTPAEVEAWAAGVSHGLKVLSWLERLLVSPMRLKRSGQKDREVVLLLFQPVAGSIAGNIVEFVAFAPRISSFL